MISPESDQAVVVEISPKLLCGLTVEVESTQKITIRSRSAAGICIYLSDSMSIPDLQDVSNHFRQLWKQKEISDVNDGPTKKDEDD